MNVRLTTKVAGALAGALLLSTTANAGSACGKVSIAEMNIAENEQLVSIAKIAESDDDDESEEQGEASE